MDIAAWIGLFGGFGVVLFGAWQCSARGGRIDIFSVGVHLRLWSYAR